MADRPLRSADAILRQQLARPPNQGRGGPRSLVDEAVFGRPACPFWMNFCALGDPRTLGNRMSRRPLLDELESEARPARNLAAPGLPLLPDGTVTCFPAAQRPTICAGDPGPILNSSPVLLPSNPVAGLFVYPNQSAYQRPSGMRRPTQASRTW